MEEPEEEEEEEEDVEALEEDAGGEYSTATHTHRLSLNGCVKGMAAR